VIDQDAGLQLLHPGGLTHWQGHHCQATDFQGACSWVMSLIGSGRPATQAVPVQLKSSKRRNSMNTTELDF